MKARRLNAAMPVLGVAGAALAMLVVALIVTH